MAAAVVLLTSAGPAAAAVCGPPIGVVFTATGTGVKSGTIALGNATGALIRSVHFSSALSTSDYDVSILPAGGVTRLYFRGQPAAHPFNVEPPGGVHVLGGTGNNITVGWTSGTTSATAVSVTYQVTQSAEGCEQPVTVDNTGLSDVIVLGFGLMIFLTGMFVVGDWGRRG